MQISADSVTIKQLGFKIIDIQGGTLIPFLIY